MYNIYIYIIYTLNSDQEWLNAKNNESSYFIKQCGWGLSSNELQYVKTYKYMCVICTIFMINGIILAANGYGYSTVADHKLKPYN